MRPVPDTLTTEILYTLHECPGVIRCLRCDKWFKSWHTRRNRMCEGCTHWDARKDY